MSPDVPRRTRWGGRVGDVMERPEKGTEWGGFVYPEEQEEVYIVGEPVNSVCVTNTVSRR